MGDFSGLTVVSNRLPVVMKVTDGGGWHVQPGSGGLIQALHPVLAQQGGCWVGWPGVGPKAPPGWKAGLDRVSADSGYELRPVLLNEVDRIGFYEGFANSVLWPLFHGFPDRAEFRPQFYEAYERVNQAFRKEVQTCTDQESFIWVHDYHFLPLARHLKQAGHRGRLAFFLHIPFPSVENFAKLPWREELLRDLLHFDLLGFQTNRDLHHFCRAVESLQIGLTEPIGPGRRAIEFLGRTLRAGAFPIGMDFTEFSTRAESPDVSRRVEELQSEIGPYQFLLGVDRLDYSKGLLHRLRAYELALENDPSLHEKIVFFQLVVPSRENVPEYQALKREFDRIVGRINGRFSTPGWQPIHYLYNRVSPLELTALYRLASVALVTPLRDGMNLVAKEFCASQVDRNGVLLLSEFAGAAEQLHHGALLVNPYDVAATADAISEAISMPIEERIRRMDAMRRVIKEKDVYWWAETFLQEAMTSVEEVHQHVIDTRFGHPRSSTPQQG